MDPRELNPDIPENIVRIVMRALEKDPEMRYTSAKAMMQDLNYAISVDRGIAPNWPRHNPLKNIKIFRRSLFIWMRMIIEQNSTSHPMLPTNHQDQYLSPVQRPEIRNNHRESSSSTVERLNPNLEPWLMGEQTMMNLERLSGASTDKDKTLFERTVVYLENLQASLPWWQKLLFGLLTIAVILGLSFWGLASLWSLITEYRPKRVIQYTATNA